MQRFLNFLCEYLVASFVEVQPVIPEEWAGATVDENPVRHIDEENIAAILCNQLDRLIYDSLFFTLLPSQG